MSEYLPKLQVLGGGLSAVIGEPSVTDTNSDNSDTTSSSRSSDETLRSSSNPNAISFAPIDSGLPSVLFVMGANGMGKTTTIGKIANRLREQNGQKVNNNINSINDVNEEFSVYLCSHMSLCLAALVVMITVIVAV
jgi:ABC-type transport system involved in cytochrome bd biosynthesis fused ATPase/permease subunit